MRILHVLRAADDRRAVQVATQQASHHEVALLLLQAATGCREPFAGPVFYCQADAQFGEVRNGARPLDYDGIVGLMVDYEQVVVW